MVAVQRLEIVQDRSRMRRVGWWSYNISTLYLSVGGGGGQRRRTCNSSEQRGQLQPVTAVANLRRRKGSGIKTAVPNI